MENSLALCTLPLTHYIENRPRAAPVTGIRVEVIETNESETEGDVSAFVRNYVDFFSSFFLFIGIVQKKDFFKNIW